MDISKVRQVVGIITGSIMVIAYSVVLLHVRMGNKNVWLTWVTVALLVS